MPTIRLLSEQQILNGPDAHVVAKICRREKRLFNIETLSNVWKAQAHLPGYIEANWNRSRAIMQRGKVSPMIKEMVATAVSMVNVCAY